MAIHAGNVALLGGELCLDFANTIDYRGTDLARELLVGYPDLVLWGRHVGILTDKQPERLLAEATQRPEEARAILERAVAVRETIYRIFVAIAHRRPPGSEDLDALNALLSTALSRLRVASQTGGFAWDWVDGDRALDCMLWPIARSAAELLTCPELFLVKQCAGCGWLFVDRSRNHNRRWCDMRVCGNRAKVRSYYQRQRKGDVRNSSG
jgi:predicted RNA-binding Zn ribbon-like protein